MTLKHDWSGAVCAYRRAGMPLWKFRIKHGIEFSKDGRLPSERSLRHHFQELSHGHAYVRTDETRIGKQLSVVTLESLEPKRKPIRRSATCPKRLKFTSPQGMVVELETRNPSRLLIKLCEMGVIK